MGIMGHPQLQHVNAVLLQGLPFCVAGIGDFLALFRCISCRYCFGTDVQKPELLGAPGRVYTTLTVHFPTLLSSLSPAVPLLHLTCERISILFGKNCAKKVHGVFAAHDKLILLHVVRAGWGCGTIDTLIRIEVRAMRPALGQSDNAPEP